MTTDREAAAASEPLQPLPEANLYAHELLSNGGGIWLACASEIVVRQAHDPGETGEEIRALFTADQMREYVLADRRAAVSSASAMEVLAELVKVQDLQKSRAQAERHAAKFPSADNYAVVDKLWTEIARRQSAAWDRARALLSQAKERNDQ